MKPVASQPGPAEGLAPTFVDRVRNCELKSSFLAAILSELPDHVLAFPDSREGLCVIVSEIAEELGSIRSEMAADDKHPEGRQGS